MTDLEKIEYNSALTDYDREYLESFHNAAKKKYPDCSEITFGKHSCEVPDDFYGFTFTGEDDVKYHVFFEEDGCCRNTGDYDHEVSTYEI